MKQFGMEVTAIVPYAGSLAHYTITYEDNNIFNARLQRLDGKQWQGLPLSVTLRVASAIG